MVMFVDANYHNLHAYPRFENLVSQLSPAIYSFQKTVVDKQEKRNQERLKRREEREKEERMKKRWVQVLK